MVDPKLETDRSPKLVGRRDAARAILFLFGGAALVVACGDGSGSTSTPANGDGDADAGTNTGTEDDGASVVAGDWASGGTQAMTAKDSYPDPFATGAATCLVLTSVTEGPCTEAADQVREDISEGFTGLPLRLVLRVVDGDCNAIAGAKVKVWHTQVNGSYSGDTPNNGMCLKDSADAAKHYFRGVQTTDDDGRVAFDTCFPGWYRGRAIHIHFTLSFGGKSFTSQLAFDEALISEIFSAHPEYSPFGAPDTPNASDNIFGGEPESFIVTTARMSDGAMLASKQLVLA